MDEVHATIARNGGSVASGLSAGVTYFIATQESARVFSNPYKLQFHPDLESQIKLFAVSFLFSLISCLSLPISILMHKKKVLDVSFIDAAVANNAVPPPAKFCLSEFDEDVESKYSIAKEAASSLDPRVQRLVTDLFDQKQLDKSLVELGLDVRRISLVTQDKIKEAYKILSTIETKLKPAPGQLADDHTAELARYSTLFYGLVPHSGESRTLPTLNSTEALKDKAALLAVRSAATPCF